MPSAFASSERDTTHPSLLESTTEDSLNEADPFERMRRAYHVTDSEQEDNEKNDPLDGIRTAGY